MSLFPRASSFTDKPSPPMGRINLQPGPGPSIGDQLGKTTRLDTVEIPRETLEEWYARLGEISNDVRTASTKDRRRDLEDLALELRDSLYSFLGG